MSTSEGLRKMDLGSAVFWTRLQGYFQGQCMKISGGTVNPKMLAQLLKKALDGEA